MTKNKEIQHIPSPEILNRIIEKYKISGIDKTAIEIVRDVICEHISDKNGILCHLDFKIWKSLQNGYSINKELSEKIEKLEKSQYFENIKSLIIENEVLKIQKEQLLKELNKNNLRNRICKILKIKI